MKKPNIKKLKYPLWFQIIFLVCTILAPLVTLVVQGLNSPNKIFRITFTVISVALVAWIFIYTFIIKGIEDRLEKRKTALEHDYEIDVGDSKKCKWLWFSNELTLSIIKAVHVALIGLLIMLIAIGIQEAALQIKGAAFFIMVLYLIAYIAKFILILILRGKELNDDKEVNNE